MLQLRTVAKTTGAVVFPSTIPKAKEGPERKAQERTAPDPPRHSVSTSHMRSLVLVSVPLLTESTGMPSGTAVRAAADDAMVTALRQKP